MRALLAAAGASGTVAAAALVIAHPLVLIGVALAPLAVLVPLAAPLPLAVGFGIASMFRIHEAVPALMPLKLPQLLALGTLAGLVWGLLSGRVRAFWSVELSWFLGFTVLITLGALVATDRSHALGLVTGTWLKIALMVPALAWIADRPWHFRLFCRAAVVTGVGIASLALYNKANGIGLVEGTRVTIGRDIGSQLGDPNDLALVLLFPISFALALTLRRGLGAADRLVGAAGFITCVLGVLATQSRGGLLGIVAVTGLAAWRRVRSKALLLTAGGLALVGLMAVAGISSRASGGAHEDGIDESAMGRLYAWGAAWRMALARPLTGVGADNFHDNYFFFSRHWDGKNHAVHSTWFQVLAETGFPGLIVYGTLLTLTLRTAWRLAGQTAVPGRDGAWYAATAEAMAAGIIGFAVAGTFLTMAYAWGFPMLLAATLALARAMTTTRLSSPSGS
ncbi:MAG: oligosaccharide repeat unit polymerase [Alphaproteobacteria bacterium]|nr:O-antigen ligase family protein [Alphaproteobacteria bacterium]TAD89623.1 MAG: oligosaccharide repeat unit polymerase [Alphaproteobacteria bacterium]